MLYVIPIEAIKILVEEERTSGIRLMATPSEMLGAYKRGFRDCIQGRPRGRASADVFGAYDRGYNEANIRSTVQ